MVDRNRKDALVPIRENSQLPMLKDLSAPGLSCSTGDEKAQSGRVVLNIETDLRAGSLCWHGRVDQRLKLQQKRISPRIRGLKARRKMREAKKSWTTMIQVTLPFVAWPSTIFHAGGFEMTALEANNKTMFNEKLRRVCSGSNESVAVSEAKLR